MNGHTIDRCFKLQRQRENFVSIDKGKRLAATAQHDEAPSSDSVQHNIPSFTHDQYTKLLALLNKHDLETSVSPGDSSNAAMLAGKVFCFSVSNPGLRWIIDSGATDHITPNLQYFSSYSPLSQESFIVMPNGKHAKIHHIGTIQLTPSLTLSHALHVQEFHYNLLSASKLAKELAANVIFTPHQCYLQGPSMRQPLAIGKENGGLYLMDHKFYNPSSAGSSNLSFLPGTTAAPSAFSCQMSPLELWHCRLGHISFGNMKHIDAIPSCKSRPNSVCQVCHHAKQHRDSFPDSTSCTFSIFEIIYVDLWGPYAHPTHNGYKYFLTIVDDH